MNNFEPIAIVGIGCRFPGGANDAETYWKLLCEGVDAISEVPQDRWNLNSYFDSDRSQPGKTYTRYGGFVDDIDQFDAGFFGISPREAACMDPQQRMLLEITWEAFADAGINVDDLAGTNVGTFMGIFTHDYNNLLLDSKNRDLIDFHTGVGVSQSIVANRISYLFDFIGPSVTLDTACSSSLVALHLACQSIHNGDSRVAVVGGANALLKPEFTIATSKASMLSLDGRCKSFDASANGYVRSEGAGVVIIKSLKDAQKDGDIIYSVINSTVVNQDGKSNGITVPNQNSQKLALRQALKRAQISADDISYVEAHGTGTFVGDPIEANSIGSILGADRQSDLYIGSVKSNIGHLEAASGVAGLIKVCLSLKEKQIPPNIHFKQPNPQIEFEKYHLRVPIKLEAWATDADKPRRACINSFGFGGTNATIILSEYTTAPSQGQSKTSTANSVYILPISARSPKALDNLVEKYAQHLASDELSLSNLCYSAANRASHNPERLALVGSSREDLLNVASSYLKNQDSFSKVRGNAAYTGGKLAFVFGGMGSQWWAMGRQLLNGNTIFRDTIEQCDRLLLKHTTWSLVDELKREEADSRLNSTQFAQPAIFAVEVGLAKVWESLGITPNVICGHSVGEIAAAHIAGALSLVDAITVIFYRSLLQHKTAGMGSMLAAAVSKNNAVHLIVPYKGKISIAAVNSPTSVTLAGDKDALADLEQSLSSDNIFCRHLNVEVPFHSHVMDQIKDDLLESLQSIQPRATKIPLYSTVTGSLIDGAELNANYWWQNVRQPVEFAKTIRSMEGVEIFLEVSPHTVLNLSIEECQSNNKNKLVLGSVRRNQNEATSLASTLGALYAYGYALKWEQIYQGNYVKLPSYPWQRQRFWLESDISKEDRIGNMEVHTSITGQSHPLLGNHLQLAHQDTFWEARANSNKPTILAGHGINGSIVFPGAGFVEMVLSAATASEGEKIIINDFSFEKALLLKQEVTKLQTVRSGNTVSIYSTNQSNDASVNWIRNASGVISPPAPEANTSLKTFDQSGISHRCLYAASSDQVYDAYSSLGFNYTGDFRGIQTLKYNAEEALSLIVLPTNDALAYVLYPPLLDNAFQTLLSIIVCNNADTVSDRVFLPTDISQLTLLRGNYHEVSEYWCHAVITESSDRGLLGNADIYQTDGTLVARVEGLRCVSVHKEIWDSLVTDDSSQEHDTDLFQVSWIPSSPTPEPTDPPTSNNWLIVADGAGDANKLYERLISNGSEAVILPIADVNDEGLEAQLNSASTKGSLAGIIYMSSLDIASNDAYSDPTAGCSKLLRLIQALNRLSVDAPLWVITRGAQHLASGSTQPEQAALWGFTQVISLENPNIFCRCVDLDPSVADNTENLHALLKSDTSETKIALRSGTQYVSRLKPYTLSNDTFDLSLDGPGSGVKSDASYLITGAFGALGRLITGRLIESGAKNLILISRSGSAGNEDYVSNLESAGVHIWAGCGDVSEPSDIMTILQESYTAMPPVKGVIHAAGVLDDQVIAHQSLESFERAMRPKVQGTWNLHQATLECSLDFFVCFSSVASLIGSPGQSNYAAANAYMDAFSSYRRALGLPSISINWGPWGGEGMASAELNRLAAKGFEPLDESRGLRLFELLLTGEHPPQVGVAPISWTKFFEEFPNYNVDFLSNFSAGSHSEDGVGKTFLLELERTEDSKKGELLLSHISSIVNSVFGCDPTRDDNRETSLFDNGLDSLMALEIKNKLERSLGLPLPSTLLFDHSTVSELGSFLMQEFGYITPESGNTRVSTEALMKELDKFSDAELAEMLKAELD